MDGSRSSARSTNPRVGLTDAERARIDALDEASRPVVAKGAEVMWKARRAIAAETSEALRRAIPGLADTSRAQRERHASDFEALKGLGASPAFEHVTPVGDLATMPIGSLLGGDDRIVIPGVLVPTQPAHVGELWWAETNWFTSAPDNSVFVDIDHDPYRIWGHIRYAGDPLLSGHVGIAMTFVLGPDRLPVTDRQTFEVRPELRPGGWVSGWTDQYHPIWHADDKWSKCWHFLGATLTTSAGPVLAADQLHQNLFSLENANPVGQGSASEFFGWNPVLVFNADMRDLRARGTSLILRTELRYDFQLEGGADIWFRHRNGSAAESVPAFDNAVTFRCWPGTVIPR